MAKSATELLLPGMGDLFVLYQVAPRHCQFVGNLKTTWKSRMGGRQFRAAHLEPKVAGLA
jgi:hypothetical protein